MLLFFVLWDYVDWLFLIQFVGFLLLLIIIKINQFRQFKKIYSHIYVCVCICAVDKW